MMTSPEVALDCGLGVQSKWGYGTYGWYLNIGGYMFKMNEAAILAEWILRTMPSSPLAHPPACVAPDRTTLPV